MWEHEASAARAEKALSVQATEHEAAVASLKARLDQDVEARSADAQQAAEIALRNVIAEDENEVGLRWRLTPANLSERYKNGGAQE